MNLSSKDEMPESPATLIFVSACHFWKTDAGLALRTSLAFQALSGIAGMRRVLIAPGDSAIRELCDRTGWEHHPLKRYSDLREERLGSLRLYWNRWSTAMTARFSDRAGARFVSMMGGSDWLITAEILELIRSHPTAVIWLSRADLLNLVPLLGDRHRVILDSNDSIANLARTYNPRRLMRRLAGYTQASLVETIERHEQSLAAGCDLIIAISGGDAEYFRRTSREVVLEEACAVAPPPADGSPQPVHDVGFIGSLHGGSISAARNLVEMAKTPELRHLRFGIAGGVCAAMRNEKLPANVVLLGRVASALEFIRSCRQILLWSNGETGTSVKFQEAILSGATVIANANAARWSAARVGRDFLLCNTVDEARTCLRAGTRLDTSDFIRMHTSDAVLKRISSLVLRDMGSGAPAERRMNGS